MPNAPTIIKSLADVAYTSKNGTLGPPPTIDCAACKLAIVVAFFADFFDIGICRGKCDIGSLNSI